MSGAVVIIPADEREPIRESEREKQPELRELHDIVDGYIEPVPYWTTFGGKPCVVYCNEDGKRRRLPPNRRATSLWYQKLFAQGDNVGGDFLVGDVVVLVDLPDEPEEE
jgi:hypothetical protein